jgi:hypothetical protein
MMPRRATLSFLLVTTLLAACAPAPLTAFLAPTCPVDPREPLTAVVTPDQGVITVPPGAAEPDETTLNEGTP